MIIELKI